MSEQLPADPLAEHAHLTPGRRRFLENDLAATGRSTITGVAMKEEIADMPDAGDDVGLAPVAHPDAAAENDASFQALEVPESN